MLCGGLCFLQEFEMKSELPRNYTLEDLLAADPIGALYRAQIKVTSDYTTANSAQLAEFEKLEAGRDKLLAQKPERGSELNKYPIETAEGRVAIATLLELSLETVAGAYGFLTGFKEASASGVPDKALIRSWRALKRQAKIPDVGPENFPTVLTKPLLVLYSADWCPPCRVMRPTFARLRKFFDKADVGYCHNDEWRKSRGINFIPQFVVYFPSGTEVSSGVPGTTQETWDVMNNLVALGQSYQGKGVLECSDEKCAIVPSENKTN